MAVQAIPIESPRKRKIRRTYAPGPLPESGLVRLPAILAHIPVSRSTWWSWVKSGRVNKPVKLGPRLSAWPADYIREFANKLAMEASNG